MPESLFETKKGPMAPEIKLMIYNRINLRLPHYVQSGHIQQNKKGPGNPSLFEVRIEHKTSAVGTVQLRLLC